MTAQQAGSAAVDAYLAGLDHPFTAQVADVRAALLAADPEVTERVAWNAPSFARDGVDRVTFRLHPRQVCQLVLHCGATPRAGAPPVVADPDGLLVWKAPDRAVLSFATPAELTARHDAVLALALAWMRS